MTVQELIEALRDFPQDVDVYIPDHHATVPIVIALEARYLPESNMVTII